MYLSYSSLNWHIIYFDTPNIKDDMNEFVKGFRWILLRLGGGVHYQTDTSCIIVGLCTMGGCQVLPFDCFIRVTCAVIIKGSGIIMCNHSSCHCIRWLHHPILHPFSLHTPIVDVHLSWNMSLHLKTSLAWVNFILWVHFNFCFIKNKIHCSIQIKTTPVRRGSIW